MQVASNFGVSKALLAAVELGLYTILAKGPMTLEQISEKFDLQRRPAMDFLDLLVSVGLLDREGDGEAAYYRNTETTETFLVQNKPSYMGGILELWNTRNYRFWSDFTEALKTGKAQSETKNSDTSFFEVLYSDSSRLEAFMEAMNGASFRNFEMLAQVFPWGKYNTVTDVGGADALLSRTLATAHPNLRFKSFDLAAVKKIADRKIAAANLTDRIEAVGGDFFVDPVPPAEIITMGMILHAFNLEGKKILVKKAYDALPPGGAFMTIESLIDDARRTNTFALFMSLNMLIELGDAFDYSASEFISWCREVGFQRFETIPLQGSSSAVVAYK
ncbi:MAG: methyltransferase, partial [Cyanobacteria bacterium P01_H01_bin.15]